MKGVNIFLADGFEDVEAIGTRDVLVRGGIDVRLVAIGDEPFVTSSHGAAVGVDAFLDDIIHDREGITAEDVMIFPGGMPGSKNLAACAPLIEAMNSHYAAGGTVAAICAAPGLVLSQLDGIEGAEFTCFSSFERYCTEKGAGFNPVPSVRSGRIITGRGAGYALDFGLEILSALRGPDAAAAVRSGLYSGDR